jgi:RNA polymerase sigma-70 factor (ECF subfamily)
VSESSYSKAGEPLKDAVHKGENVPKSEDLFDALFEWMPNDDFPIPDVSPRDRSLTTEADVADVRELPSSRFFSNGQIKKSPVLARSFTDEFIDSKAGGPESDEELFRRYQQGDDKAFFSLYERYKGSVFAYCSKVLLSVGLAEELVQDTYQEVFLRVSQYRNTFTQGEFRAWIFTITRNTCLSWKKRGLKSVMTSGAFDPDHLTEEQALASPSNVQRSDDPLELLTQKEQTDMLLKAISELPETYREALMLCEYEGLTYEEIGRLTGTSLSTIRIRVFRAKKRLRKILQPMMGTLYQANIGKEEEHEHE